MYAKVFAQMYDGTLCTRGPWQALVTFQQMLVLADQDGNLDMTPVAISRRTTIPLEIIETGIEELLKADSESRTPTLDGRRIVPLAEGRHWGWHIVNYKHYRELKREEDRREYHRTYWATKRSPNAQKTQPDSTHSTESTYAEAYAEAKEVKRTAKRSSSAFSLPDWMPADAWAGYEEMRKKAGKAMTDRARKLKVSKLEELKNAGHDVSAILDRSTENNWTDLYEPKAGATGYVASGRPVY